MNELDSVGGGGEPGKVMLPLNARIIPFNLKSTQPLFFFLCKIFASDVLYSVTKEPDNAVYWQWWWWNTCSLLALQNWSVELVHRAANPHASVLLFPSWPAFPTFSPGQCCVILVVINLVAANGGPLCALMRKLTLGWHKLAENSIWIQAASMYWKCDFNWNVPECFGLSFVSLFETDPLFPVEELTW